MNIKDDGGSIFPSPGKSHQVFDNGALIGGGATFEQTGISLRDHIAIEAMKSLIPLCHSNGGDYITEKAYVFADSMIKARKP